MRRPCEEDDEDEEDAGLVEAEAEAERRKLEQGGAVLAGTSIFTRRYVFRST